MSKPEILLIEDDVWLAQSYVDVLKDTYSLRTVENGSAAIDIIDTQVFDLIIADMMLENGLVIDLLHELQTHSDTMSIPIIICSSLASSIDIKDMKTYGVVAVLDKSSLTPQSLRVAVQRALGTEAV